jgi:hypothetical protein
MRPLRGGSGEPARLDVGAETVRVDGYGMDPGVRAVQAFLDEKEERVVQEFEATESARAAREGLAQPC